MRRLVWMTSAIALLACGFICGNGVFAATSIQAPPNLLLNLMEQSNAHVGSEDEYLRRVNQSLSTAEAHLRDVQATTSHLKTQISAEQQRVIPILQFQYEQGPAAILWLSLLFSASDWRSFQSGYADLTEILHNRQRILHQFAQDMQHHVSLQNDALSTVQDVQLAQLNISAEKQMYQAARSASADAQNGPGLMRTLTRMVEDAWSGEVAPQVGNTLTQLDIALRRLPDTLPKSDIQISLTQAEVTIPQAVLNQLIQADSNLQDVQFLFRDKHLLLSAQASGQRVLMVGHFSIEANRQRADYVVDEVAVDGILVSVQTAQQWLQDYAFYIDVTRLSRHLRIRSITIENQVLTFALDARI